MYIIKRNGTQVEFDSNKIKRAIEASNGDVSKIDQISEEAIDEIVAEVEKAISQKERAVSVEEIQDLVQNHLMNMKAFTLATNYITYRYKRALVRKANSTDKPILSLLECRNEEIKQENSNKNPTIVSVQRDYMAGEVSKDLTKRFLLDKDIVDAHEQGLIHFHDSDYFAQQIHNCCLVNLEDMLQNGTVISGTKIDPPKGFVTACNIATQAVAQVASSQYGGQTITLSHLAPFVEVERQKIKKAFIEDFANEGIEISEDRLNKLVEKRVRKAVRDGMQLIQYQVNTLMTTNGQAPFITVFMYLDEVPEGQLRDDLAMLIEEMLHQRILGVKNEKGVYVTPAFPKLIYVLDEDNVSSDSKYFWLTELSARCTAKRMVPDYISAKMMKQLKSGDIYSCMGCRSFLTVDRTTENLAKALNYKEGEHKYYGRFNQGVVTLNLVDVACSSGKDETEFWRILDERLELCHRALRKRHERLLGTKSDVAPILWQNGALARLEKGETIDKLLYDGYSTISLGFAGLYEMCYYMTGKSHTDPEAKPFALAVMQRLNDACAKWKAAENIDYSVYGTPLESTTYKFAKCLQKRFGKIPGVTDRNYISNSYHVPVFEHIDAFSKLKFESEFQALAPGGAISYVEVPNMQHNIEAVVSIIQYIYENIMYAELNTKSDYCSECGYDGEIQIVEDEHKKLVWECPNCKNRNQDTMSVARRTCGYIGSQYWNQGRTQEIKERVLHVSEHMLRL